jgi:hypothetical protein
VQGRTASDLSRGPGSWSENHGQAIGDAATTAFAKLTTGVPDDIEGISTTIDPQGTTTEKVYRAH